MDRKEKNRGAEINLPDFFPLCTTCQKILPCKLSTIVVDEGGPGGGATIFSLHFQLLCSIFPQILREFLLFIFVISQYCPTVKRILHDWPNLPNNRGGGAAACGCTFISQAIPSYWTVTKIQCAQSPWPCTN
jgi:hypothetical protein